VANVTGGAGVLTVSYTGLPPGCASRNYTVLLCSPSSGAGSTFRVRASVTDTAGDSSASPALPLNVTAQTALAGNLTLGAPIGNLSQSFWGVNYDYAGSGPPGTGNFDNRTIVSDVEKTPITSIRFPLPGPTPDQSYTTEYKEWTSMVAFCHRIDCESVVTVGGANETPAIAAAEVQFIQDHYHFNATYWVYGNEPNVYDWASPSAYAATVHQWILDVRAFDPHAHFMGIEITGDPGVDQAYLTDLVKEDGTLISGFAIQTYPDNPPDDRDLSNFMGALSGPHSVLNEAHDARSFVDAAGGSDLPMFDNEFNGGGESLPGWASFRQGYADVPFTAASVIQALEGGIVMFNPWTLTSSLYGVWTQHGTDGCENAMIELSDSCDGIHRTFNPTYYLYSQIFDHIPTGAMTSVKFPGAWSLTGIQITEAGETDVLVVNENPHEMDSFQLGPGFSQYGNVSTILLDPASPTVPLLSSLSLPISGSAGPLAFTVPALGVMLLQFD
jgi:hypothetical protein